MTNEQLNQYYSKDADKKQCWVSKDHNCPLKEQCMETKTASEMWDIMEELGIAVDKSFIEPCDLTPPTLEELCRMFGVNSLEELRNMPHGPMAF